MLNIISLQALRSKSTWPSKVVKNLMKWLDLIWYPYILNANLNSCEMLYIHDDLDAFLQIPSINKNIKIIAWPNIDNNDKWLLKWFEDRYYFIYPSNRIQNIWNKRNRHKNSIVRPAWIDTDKFKPSDKKKEKVLIYFKTRFPEELKLACDVLNKNNINFEIINYDEWYREQEFIKKLEITKYVIWIWRQETQWIALQEIMSMNIPILVWDVKKVWHWLPKNNKETDTVKDILEEKSTSAEYFNEECWYKIYNKEDLEKYIMKINNEYKNIHPRKYILEYLDISKKAKDLLNFYKNTLWVDINNAKFSNHLIKWRFNIFLKFLFFLLDLKITKIFYKKIISIYFNFIKNKK